MIVYEITIKILTIIKNEIINYENSILGHKKYVFTIYFYSKS
jgi:hypothetical protein